LCILFLLSLVLGENPLDTIGIVSLIMSGLALGISWLAYKNSRTDRRQDLRIETRELLDGTLYRAEALPQQLDEYHARMKSHLGYSSKLNSGIAVQLSEEFSKFHTDATGWLTELKSLDSDISKKSVPELEHISSQAKRISRNVDGLSADIEKRLTSFEASEEKQRETGRDFRDRNK